MSVWKENGTNIRCLPLGLDQDKASDDRKGLCQYGKRTAQILDAFHSDLIKTKQATTGRAYVRCIAQLIENIMSHWLTSRYAM